MEQRHRTGSNVSFTPRSLVIFAVTCGMYILLSVCAVAQPVDSIDIAVPIDSSSRRSTAPSFWYSAGLEGITKPSGGLRGVAGLGNDYFMLAPITIAFVRGATSGRMHVSANPVILVPIAILDLLGSSTNGYRWQGLAWFGFFLSLANPTLQYPLLKDQLYVDAALHNDIYFFEDPITSYSEISLGLQVRPGGVKAGAGAVLPLSGVYFGDRKPYLGMNLFYQFQ